MSSMRLRGLALDSQVLDKLHKCKITTCKDVLRRHWLDLMNDADISCSAAQEVMTRVSVACAPIPVTALEMLNEKKSYREVLGTSLAELDHVLHGGIHARGITEVTGPPGCGKTQFCIMLTTLALMNDGDFAVIYIDTEAAFSSERLLEIAESRHPELFGTAEALQSLAMRVLVLTELTCSSLLRRLELLEETIITSRACLVIIDSIASPVRKEFDAKVKKNMIERSNWLMKFAALLKYTADTFSIPIVVTNQITTHGDWGKKPPDDELDYLDALAPALNASASDSSSSYVTAALGNSWSHCVNTRLILQYAEESGTRRQIMVAKSPVAPFTKFTYTIQASGIVLEENGAEHYSGTDPTLQRIHVRSAT